MEGSCRMFLVFKYCYLYFIKREEIEASISEKILLWNPLMKKKIICILSWPNLYPYFNQQMQHALRTWTTKQLSFPSSLTKGMGKSGMLQPQSPNQVESIGM